MLSMQEGVWPSTLRAACVSSWSLGIHRNHRLRPKGTADGRPPLGVRVCHLEPSALSGAELERDGWGSRFSRALMTSQPLFMLKKLSSSSLLITMTFSIDEDEGPGVDVDALAAGLGAGRGRGRGRGLVLIVDWVNVVEIGVVVVVLITAVVGCACVRIRPARIGTLNCRSHP